MAGRLIPGGGSPSHQIDIGGYGQSSGGLGNLGILGGLFGQQGATPSKSFYGTPTTTFPKYSSGSWANLPTGMMGAPQPAQTPAPGAQPQQGQTYYPVNPLGPYSGPIGTAPSPTPTTPQNNSPLSGLFGGNFDLRQ